jgi:uncharacterized protein
MKKLKLLEQKCMQQKNIKVIFDTNIWISFLIGKKVKFIKHYIDNGFIKIIVSLQLIEEIKMVTQRENLKKYFNKNDVANLVSFLNSASECYKTIPKHFNSRDLKDNFLLDLIDESRADYLITGDKDLLVLNPFKNAKIISPFEFEEIISKTLLQ